MFPLYLFYAFSKSFFIKFCKFNSEVQPVKLKKEPRSRGCEPPRIFLGLVERFFCKKSLKTKKPKNCSLSASEQARNTKLARCRIVIEHTFAHLKK